MHIRKAAALLMTVALLVVPASAHGGHGHCRQQTVVQPQPIVYQLCTAEDCTIAGRHFHDGAPYCGAAHTGVSCDGSCLTRPLCTADGCTLTGHHQHNGEGYCGAVHACGWCDGTCQVTVSTATTGTQTVVGHHHGGHC